MPLRESTSLVCAAWYVDFEVPTLADAELYGSKLVAALDRQRPRDIFDVQHMFDTYGLRDDFVAAFVGYLAGHNRPVHEVLFCKTPFAGARIRGEFCWDDGGRGQSCPARSSSDAASS
ncbi:nucleotidyl transferase AbiEii/AbiGii toxin family protein [Paraburkholderia tropica]|uniref:nucleotidyl transferase AbiEii/AbiGii toxin family protein n=1 Tax=Paraburkholderia tropica TaxID=92647 RepID=UPI003D2A6C7E